MKRRIILAGGSGFLGKALAQKFVERGDEVVVLARAPRERSGAAAGLQSTGRLIGQSLGTALVAVAFGRAPQHATSIALWGAAALTLAGACSSGLRRAD